MTPYYDRDGITIYCGDCLEVMPELEAESIDTIITDPPYGLKFMGKYWDHGVPGVRFWQEALRVAKPGAMNFAFGGTRTHHRLMCAIEDAGWEIRDVIMWVYGSGFPKSHDISKAIDKAAGAEREIIEIGDTNRTSTTFHGAEYKGGWTTQAEGKRIVTTPATAPAKLWDGWGTALKPAWEPIIISMKPLDGTFAQNALKHGVAGLWVDGGRVPTNERPHRIAYGQNKKNNASQFKMGSGNAIGTTQQGRWPANLIHDGSDEVVGLFPSPHSAGYARNGRREAQEAGLFGIAGGDGHRFGDSGTAARFFYCAKASRKERGKGNNHPTVKPLSLLRYLCRLTKTPTGGTVLDLFMGSGTTLLAADQEGRSAKGIEISEEYCKIAIERLRQRSMFQVVEMPRQPTVKQTELAL